MTAANRGVSRREFLRLSGAGLAGAALLGAAGCGDYGVTFKMKDPSTVVERYVLREHIRADSVYGEFARKAQELFDSGADPESAEFRQVRTEFEEFRPEEMVVTGPFQVDQTEHYRVTIDAQEGPDRLERRPGQIRQGSQL